MDAPPRMELRYRLIRAFLRLAFSILGRVHVQGLEKLPRRGRLILVTNHLHLFDPPLIMAVAPLRIIVLAAEKWERRPPLSVLFKLLNAVFVNRGTPDLAALRRIERVLQQGGVVGIAPEGTRSPTKALQHGKGGAALLASRTGATLVPIAVYGHERIGHELLRLRRAEIHVIVGDPFSLPAPSRTNRRQQLQEMTTEIMVRLARLLPPAYRGVYAPLLAAEEAGGQEASPAA